MKYVKSCGFVVFKQIDNKNHYLLIKSLNGDVGFPKGHMESGENELQTAIRELKEETNVEVEIIKGFRKQIEYRLKKTPDTIKQSVYFLGKGKPGDIICQKTEVANADFISYEDALNILTFVETKEILKDAELFIRML